MRDKQWERIQRRIHKKPNGCHGWYGAVDSSGFPIAGGSGTGNVKVHRYLFARANPGIEIKGFCVIQTCRDHECLNVEHMQRMTKQAAERLKNPLSGRSPLLNWDIVHAIRRTPKGVRGQAGSTKDWAERTGVGESTIRLIRNNRAWRQ